MYVCTVYMCKYTYVHTRRTHVNRVLLHDILSVLIVSVSKILRLVFDVQTPSSSQRRLTAGAGREADGPRQDAANLTSLSPFQALRFNQPSLHKLLWSTFEITLSAQ